MNAYCERLLAEHWVGQSLIDIPRLEFDLGQLIQEYEIPPQAFQLTTPTIDNKVPPVQGYFQTLTSTKQAEQTSKGEPHIEGVVPVNCLFGSSGSNIFCIVRPDGKIENFKCEYNNGRFVAVPTPPQVGLNTETLRQQAMNFVKELYNFYKSPNYHQALKYMKPVQNSQPEEVTPKQVVV